VLTVRLIVQANAAHNRDLTGSEWPKELADLFSQTGGLCTQGIASLQYPHFQITETCELSDVVDVCFPDDGFTVFDMTGGVCRRIAHDSVPWDKSRRHFDSILLQGREDWFNSGQLIIIISLHCLLNDRNISTPSHRTPRTYSMRIGRLLTEIKQDTQH
jgi:hypothetical protein